MLQSIHNLFVCHWELFFRNFQYGLPSGFSGTGVHY